MIDTHAHLNFSAFKDDLDEVIRRCSDQKVGVINAGSQYSTSQRAVELAEKYENFWAAIGLHPIHLESSRIREKIDEDEEFEFDTRNEKFDAEKYRKLAESKKVVAIGETGLDYYHLGEKSKVKSQNSKVQLKSQKFLEETRLQKEIFVKQSDLAVKLNLPIIVHCRDAYSDILEILAEQKKKYGQKLRGVMHSYLGRLSHAREFNRLGFLLGFNGIITFARDYDRVIREIELENMLIETDCPYLTPVPFRGKRNEPAHVRYVAEKIAEIRGISFEKVAETTTDSAKRLFKI